MGLKRGIRVRPARRHGGEAGDSMWVAGSGPACGCGGQRAASSSEGGPRAWRRAKGHDVGVLRATGRMRLRHENPARTQGRDAGQDIAQSRGEQKGVRVRPRSVGRRHEPEAGPRRTLGRGWAAKADVSWVRVVGPLLRHAAGPASSVRAAVGVRVTHVRVPHAGARKIVHRAASRSRRSRGRSARA